jgi:hypothetical protein
MHSQRTRIVGLRKLLVTSLPMASEMLLLMLSVQLLAMAFAMLFVMSILVCGGGVVRQKRRESRIYKCAYE